MPPGWKTCPDCRCGRSMSFEQMRELPSRMIECRESDGAIIIRDATAEELAAWEASWTPPEDDGHCWVTLLPLGE